MSETAGRRYVGQTDDIDRRLMEHNDKDRNPSKFTSKHAGPWRLAYREQYTTRSEAMHKEKWLKSGIGRQWLDQTIGRASPPKAD